MAADASDLSRSIITQLTELRYECANCLDTIRHEQPIWHCLCCYRVFHFSCIKKWAKVEESGEGRSFRCPHCQAPQKPVNRHRCFCGKVQDPKVDAMLSCPHTCGSTCGRRRGDGCPHPCPNQCHPGPCPECPAMSKPKRCPCGRTTYSHRCGKADPKSTCSNICGKKLGCKKHTCALPCHHGPCTPCTVTQKTLCACGKEARDQDCGSPSFQCNAPCGKTQRCGHHTCDVVCHSGACPPCDRDPVLVVTCPCGKQPLTPDTLKERQANSCQSPIPTCGAVCGKARSCGRHACTQQCHDSSCDECNVRENMHCACRSTMSKVNCKDADAFRCLKKCKTPLQCGKHECDAICCGARNNATHPMHECKKICGKKLSCGHPCSERCHRGACPACPNIIVTPLTCACGVELIMPPLPCGTPPPNCRLSCNATRPCGHPSDDHLCHHGECPPCAKPVERLCASGHKMVGNVLCSAEHAFCIEVCGKVLDCGHVCQRTCHAGLCVSAERPCTQLCGKSLPCGHGCPQKCHPTTSTCGKCTATVELSCDCGIQSQKLACALYLRRLAEHQLKSNEPFMVGCTSDCLYEQRLSILKARSKPNDRGAGKMIYSQRLWAMGIATPDVIKSLEQRLSDFLRGSEMNLMLPPMLSEKRAVVHELCFYFHIQSESQDQEPNRTVLLTKNVRSAVPNPLVSVAIKDSSNDPNGYVLSVLRRPEEAMKRIIVFEGPEQRMGIREVSRCLSPYAGDFVVIDPLDDTLIGGPHLLDDGLSARTSGNTDRIRTLYAIFLPHRIKPAYESLRHRGCLLLFRLLGFPYPSRQFSWEPTRPTVTAIHTVQAATTTTTAAEQQQQQHQDPTEAPPAPRGSAAPWSSLVRPKVNAKTRKQHEVASIEVTNAFEALKKK